MRNWEEIQKFYDDNHTWRDVIKEFKMSNETLMKAVSNNIFKTRTKTNANILANIKSPRKHSQKTKNKISKSRIEYLKNNPDKVPYLLNHYSKGPSYPEKYFDEIFNDKFEYTKYYQISLYHIDIAIVNKKIAIEIDGEQHYLDPKIIKSDKRKNKFLTENGWNIIRIKWSDYQKFNKIEKEDYINKIIDYIKSK